MISAITEFVDDMRGGRMTENPIVTVEHGKLQGKVATSPTGKAFYSFQGIPYAKPPLGSLRFKAPQPLEPWEGVRDATAEGNVPAQEDPIIAKTFVGDENCLFLNVYTQHLDGAFLPVMVYIPGGGFYSGSGNTALYGADYLVEKDVVVVTLNYRLGPLGFLSLNTPEVPGNAGLKDIVQALNWVKENIGNFGGNPGNITLFGESAGGCAVGILTASPLAKHLFNKAIIQSSSPTTSWLYQRHPVENAKALARHLGCESNDADEILEFLSATPARELVNASTKLGDSQIPLDKKAIAFLPVVEKEFSGVESVINEGFFKMLTSGRVADIPIMAGSTSLELPYGDMHEDLRVFIPEEFNIEMNSTEAVEIAEQIKKVYFKDGHIGVANLQQYFELQSDFLIQFDVQRYIKYLMKIAKKPVYYYKFDYVGELNLAKNVIQSLELDKASHSDELGYLFRNQFQDNLEPTSQDLKTRERMVRLWTNFAKGGNPTPDETHTIPLTWIPVTKDNLYYLNISTELSLRTEPDKERMDFWESLYDKYYKVWEQDEANADPVPEKTDKIATHTEIITEVVETTEAVKIADNEEPVIVADEPKVVDTLPAVEETVQVAEETVKVAEESAALEESKAPEVVPQNGNGDILNGDVKAAKPRTSNEIKMASHSNGVPKDVVRANDPPEDDLPKNIGVNKFVNFFESLGGKKKN